MTIIKFIFILIFSFLTLFLRGQKTNNENVRSIFASYTTLVKAGHLIEAAKNLSSLLNSNIPLTPLERLAINNNLGILYKNLGQYDVSIGFYDAAESIYSKGNFADKNLLGNIYGNKVNIYLTKGDFQKALEYCEKALRFVNESSSVDHANQQSAATLYLNAGIIYFQLNSFDNAIASVQKSIFLKQKCNFSGLDKAYLNLAKTYSRIGNHILAEKYFNWSIRKSAEGGKFSSINLAQTYLEYGNFLISINEKDKALALIQKAINFNLNNFGEKNQLTSNCYQLMGDYYSGVNNLAGALTYYQKTLISGSKEFNDLNFDGNPSISEITANLWQLRVLQRKADVLASLADLEPDKNKKIKQLTLSLKTINLAIDMTNKLRVDYQDGETRLIFSEKQKSVFAGSIETALKLYNLTSEKRFLYLAYQTCQQSKANELKFEIARNKSFANIEIPDSLRKMGKEIQNNLNSYNALIQAESALATPDTIKLAYWKDQIFYFDRALEKNIETIEREFPRFTDKLKRGNIISIEAIQANLKPDDTLIEYAFSDEDEMRARKLYEFVVTPKDLVCHTELIDSTTTLELKGLKTQLVNQFAGNNGIDNYNVMNRRLYNAYTVLIQPIKKYFAGKQLIIIPDEDLSYLPFDAFLSNWTMKTKINYAELAYLIRDYSISYGYSTNTQWNNQIKAEYFPKVIGFAPHYSVGLPGVASVSYNSIKNNSIEISRILNSFRGSVFKGDQATIANFSANLGKGAVLHLAMHAELDTKMEGSSSLVFTPMSKNQDDYCLHSYEIGQKSIKSPMVVLSACNTGNGKLYSGEGLMSLARSFILAGVPCVIETLWPVEDIAGLKIMGNFYRHLSEGKLKNSAMRLAKLDYINTTSPSFVDPRFWAAYNVIGDVSAIKKFWWKEPRLILTAAISITILIVLIVFYLLRFFRIT